MMYCECCGVCDFVVLSVVEICADYGGVNVFHACLNFGVVSFSTYPFITSIFLFFSFSTSHVLMHLLLTRS